VRAAGVAVSCSERIRYRKENQKLRSNLDKSKAVDAFRPCRCQVPDLIKNNSGPIGHKLCLKCAGWKW
jgi:hypothetical protein